jgi:hypothetical protein
MKNRTRISGVVFNLMKGMLGVTLGLICLSSDGGVIKEIPLRFLPTRSRRERQSTW